MKILITEHQYKAILNEARSILDLRGKLGEDFIVTDNFYVIMSKIGNMVLLDEVMTIVLPDRDYEFEKSDKGRERTIEDIFHRLDLNKFKNIPAELTREYNGRIEPFISSTSEGVGAILYVDVNKKILHNVKSFEYVKKGYNDYKYERSEYYDPMMVKKTLNDLRAKGYINEKFKYIDVNQEDVTPNTTDYGKDGQYLYHGTTQTNANRIMKVGLRPMDTKNIFSDDKRNKSSLFRGNSSTLGGYTDKNVYLSPSLDVAKQYAFRQAKFNDDEPVILKIKVPDISRLVLDDDYILSKINKTVNTELNKRSTYLESGHDKEWPHRFRSLFKTDWSGDEIVRNFSTYVNLLWRTNFISFIEKNEYETYTDLLKDDYIGFEDGASEKIKSQLSNDFYEWLKNLVISSYNKIKNEYFRKSTFNSSDKSIAYRGPIHPNFISVVPVKYKLKRDV